MLTQDQFTGVLKTRKKVDTDYYKKLKDVSNLGENEKKKELVKYIEENILTLSESLKNAFTAEELYEKHGNHSAQIAATVHTYIVSDLIEESSNSLELPKIDFKKGFIEKEISILESTEKFKIEDDEGNEKTIEVPKFRTEKVLVANDFDSISQEISQVISNTYEPVISSLKEQISQLQQQEPISSPQVGNDQIRFQAATLLNDLLSQNEILIADPNSEDNQLRLSLSQAIDSHNINKHYSTLAKQFMDDLYKSNGIIDVQETVEHTRVVNNEDGTTHTQKVPVTVVKKALGKSRTEFASSLFGNSNITDQDGNNISLFNVYESELLKNYKKNISDWLSKPENAEISTHNNSEFYNLFVNTVGFTSSTIGNTYKLPVTNMQPNIFEDPFKQRQTTGPTITETIKQMSGVKPPQPTQFKTDANPSLPNPEEIQDPVEEMMRKKLGSRYSE